MDAIMKSAKKRTEELIANLGFDGEGIVTMSGRSVVINYQVDDAAILIGRGGEVLDALQHVMRILLSEELLKHEVDLVVDISGYREKKASALAKRAKDKAYQVLTTGIEEIFPPMSSYERMIVHTTCSNIADVETESQGSGRDRRVIIKPKR